MKSTQDYLLSGLTVEMLEGSNLNYRLSQLRDLRTYELTEAPYVGFALSESLRVPIPGKSGYQPNVVFLAVVMPPDGVTNENVTKVNMLSQVVTRFLIRDMLKNKPIRQDINGVNVSYACVGYIATEYAMTLDLDSARHSMRFGSNGYQDETGNKYRGQLAGYFVIYTKNDHRLGRIMVELGSKLLGAPSYVKLAYPALSLQEEVVNARDEMAPGIEAYINNDLRRPHKVFYKPTI